MRAGSGNKDYMILGSRSHHLPAVWRGRLARINQEPTGVCPDWRFLSLLSALLQKKLVINGRVGFEGSQREGFLMSGWTFSMLASASDKLGPRIAGMYLCKKSTDRTRIICPVQRDALHILWSQLFLLLSVLVFQRVFPLSCVLC